MAVEQTTLKKKKKKQNKHDKDAPFDVLLAGCLFIPTEAETYLLALLV